MLSYLKEVDHLGLTGEIRFDSDGFRTEVQLDLIEKVRGRFRKTATWTPEAGVNYTMTAEEIGIQLIEKLANRTLRVVTTVVSCSPHCLKLQKAAVSHFLPTLTTFSPTVGWH